MTPKPWYRSKTIWFNALTIVVAGATMFGYAPDEDLLETVTGTLIALSPVVNLVLRFVTKRPVEIAPSTD
jgi:hypothetical protein